MTYLNIEDYSPVDLIVSTLSDIFQKFEKIIEYAWDLSAYKYFGSIYEKIGDPGLTLIHNLINHLIKIFSRHYLLWLSLFKSLKWHYFRAKAFDLIK